MPHADKTAANTTQTLRLTICGKGYRVPSPPALVGLRLQAAWAVANARTAGVEPKAIHVQRVNDDPGTTTLEQDALGPVHDQLIADGVDVATLNLAGMTAFMWIVAGEHAARAWALTSAPTLGVAA